MPKRPQYTKDTLEQALKKIRENKMSLRAVAKKYNIPRTTLQFKLKYPTTKSEFGPKPYLTKQEEDCIKEWLIQMVYRGFSIRSNDVLDFVQKYLNDHPRDTPFVNNRPGLGWLKAFFKRHPTLSQSISEGVSIASSRDSPFGDSDDKNYIDFTNFWAYKNIKVEHETDTVDSEAEGSTLTKASESIDETNFCESKNNVLEDDSIGFDYSNMNIDAKEKLMSFKDFINIIGDDVLAKIMTLQCFGREVTERSPILYKLWYYFKGNQKNDTRKESTNIQIQTPSNKTTNVNLVNEENKTTVKITVTSNNNMCVPYTSKEKSSSELVNDMLQPLNRRKRQCTIEKEREASKLKNNKRTSLQRYQKGKGNRRITRSTT